MHPVNHGGIRSRYAGQLRQVLRVHLTGRTGPTREGPTRAEAGPTPPTSPVPPTRAGGLERASVSLLRYLQALAERQEIRLARLPTLSGRTHFRWHIFAERTVVSAPGPRVC